MTVARETGALGDGGTEMMNSAELVFWAEALPEKSARVSARRSGVNAVFMGDIHRVGRGCQRRTAEDGLKFKA
jgi:hypothetical protein